MSNLKISQLPIAAALTGTEAVPLVQGGLTSKTTVDAFAARASALGTTIPVRLVTATSFAVAAGDRSKLLSIANAAAVAGVLPQAGTDFPAGWFCLVQNTGAGDVTIAPTTSTIDGAAALTLTTDQGVAIVSDGANYYTMRGVGGAGGGGTAQLKSIVFTASGTLTIPAGVTSGWLTAVAGGGGGSAAYRWFLTQ